MTRNYMNLIQEQHDQGKHLCVGLDFNEKELDPAFVNGCENIQEAIVEFNRSIVEATKDLVCAYKPNRAFYARHGFRGLLALQQTIRMIIRNAPDVPVILDAKVGDIGNTNDGYADEAFDLVFEADALTINPYLGREANKPFLVQKNKGVIVLVKTSNPGSGEFQDIPLPPVGEPLYMRVAKNVANEWNYNGNCSIVVGATYPTELELVRKAVGDLPILIPGIGKQGGDLEKSVHAGKSSRSSDFIINVSRDVLYASRGLDFPQAARAKALWYHQQISSHLKLAA